MAILSKEEMRRIIEAHCDNYWACEGCKLENDDTSVCTHTSWQMATREQLETTLKDLELLPEDSNEGEKQYDPVNCPSHYTHGSIECIDAMVSAFGKESVAQFCINNAFKYIFRHKYKNGLEDIQKAKWYLAKYIELTYGDENDK